MKDHLDSLILSVLPRNLYNRLLSTQHADTEALTDHICIALNFDCHPLDSSSIQQSAIFEILSGLFKVLDHIIADYKAHMIRVGTSSAFAVINLAKSSSTESGMRSAINLAFQMELCVRTKFAEWACNSPRICVGLSVGPCLSSLVAKECAVFDVLGEAATQAEAISIHSPVAGVVISESAWAKVPSSMALDHERVTVTAPFVGSMACFKVKETHDVWQMFVAYVDWFDCNDGI
eukprot:TRINITY_DN11332_c0_g1_i1.p2 TRINITY_DN11332_c0_g1~~TRINITY_DN11332_c0_g1_i1.p2  ORF type:complete len:234 (-),score=56.49 TRINITY_DN11332_c0_g1_i1:199-900(-)